MRKPLPIATRFWRLAQVGDGCWPWLGTKNQAGYGQFRVGREGPVMTAHRVSWEIHNGPIPEGLCVCHSCDNPSCVNPGHLWLGTHKENMADMRAKGRGNTGKARKPHTRIRKLLDDDVRAIRASDEPVWKLAEQFGISEATVYGVRSRRRKSLVPDFPIDQQNP